MAHNGPPPRAWDRIQQGIDALTAYYAMIPFLCAGAAQLAVRPAHIGWDRGACFTAVNFHWVDPAVNAVDETGGTRRSGAESAWAETCPGVGA